MTNRSFLKELDDAEKDILGAKFTTAMAKAKFIGQIKQGLGEEIKKDPRAVKIIKKPWTTKLKLWLTNIFTKF